MVTSALVKPVTVSLNITVTGIGAVLVGFETVVLIVTEGTTLSKVTLLESVVEVTVVPEMFDKFL
jgi:hypothetical protein